MVNIPHTSSYTKWTNALINTIMPKLQHFSLFIPLQAPWEQRAECATSHQEAPMAVRSCAVGGATTQCGSNT